MNKKIASLMLYITSAGVIIFGLVYLFTPEIMPYHERYLGITHECLPPKIATLFLYMLKGAGSMALSIGITLFMMVKWYFCKGDKFISVIILIMMLLVLLPLLFITLSIGFYTPWWLVSLIIIFVVTAIIINR
ncbi:MAG: hypothetical protein ABRQ37_15995 [Candidatus Eremiobacterota bacterium]